MLDTAAAETRDATRGCRERPHPEQVSDGLDGKHRSVEEIEGKRRVDVRDLSQGRLV